MKKLISVLLSLILVLALPIQVLAEDYNLETGSITVNADSAGGQTVTQVNGVTNQAQTTPTVIYQGTKGEAPATPTSNTVTITGGGTANVTLDNVNISSASQAAVSVQGTTSAVVTLVGDNTVQGGDEHAGVEVSQNASLTITAESTEDSLKATGGLYGGAGIGSGLGSNNGQVIIENGTVTAQGGNNAAGIGGGNEGTGGIIEILGGEVNATGGSLAAGIGGGVHASGGQITIRGGTVEATGGAWDTEEFDGGAGIGGGSGANGGGEITITGGTVTATGYGDGIGGGRNGSEHTVQLLGGTVNGEYIGPDLPLPGQEPAVHSEKVISTEPSYWDGLIWKIHQTAEGSTLTLDLGVYTWIPRTVIQAAQVRNITLIIQWNGGEDITIHPTDEIDLTLWQVNLKDLL